MKPRAGRPAGAPARRRSVRAACSLPRLRGAHLALAASCCLFRRSPPTPRVHRATRPSLPSGAMPARPTPPPHRLAPAPALAQHLAPSSVAHATRVDAHARVRPPVYKGLATAAQRLSLLALSASFSQLFLALVSRFFCHAPSRRHAAAAVCLHSRAPGCPGRPADAYLWALQAHPLVPVTQSSFLLEGRSNRALRRRPRPSAWPPGLRGVGAGGRGEAGRAGGGREGVKHCGKERRPAQRPSAAMPTGVGCCCLAGWRRPDHLKRGAARLLPHFHPTRAAPREQRPLPRTAGWVETYRLTMDRRLRAVLKDHLCVVNPVQPKPRPCPAAAP
jgi:hypothetical protein